MASADDDDRNQPQFDYPEHLINSLIFETFGDQRYTQDSPIMPEVWAAYARAPRKPLDVLLTPRSGDSPSHLASRVAVRLADFKNIPVKLDSENDRDIWPIWSDHSIAYSRSSVVAKLTFRELICVVVPMTLWWEALLRDIESRDHRTLRAQLEGLGPDEMRLSDIILQAQRVIKRSAWDFIRFCALVGFLGLACEYENEIEGAEDEFKASEKKTKAAKNKLDRLRADRGAEIVAFMGALADGRTQIKQVRKILDAYDRVAGCVSDLKKDDSSKIFMITANRDAQLSIMESRGTIKADAANNVFDIDTKDLAWAVIDGGIDACHPAFLNRAATKEQLEKEARDARKQAAAAAASASTGGDAAGVPASENEDGDAAAKPVPLTDCVWKQDIPIDRLAKLSRVRETYDFTYLRQMLATRALPPHDKGGPCEEIKKHIEKHHTRELEDLVKRTRKNREIDWDIVAPLIRVPHDQNYDKPTIGHGTHVAGILASDWLAQDNSEGCNLVGVCPQIQLYDLRVFKPGIGSDEFTVQYALQFVQHLNRNRDLPRIHGVNLSLSMLHKVMSFACGRSPVCEECNDLVGTGVVVVVAAGNDGYKTYKTDKGDFPGYHAASITDPGNAEDVITVGATHRSQPHNYGVSYFSSRGPTGDGRRKPDLVAPGEKITAPILNCGVQRMDGTSMAAPHVSGAAALLMARHRELIGEPRRIKEILCRTATDLGREAHFQGAGMVDILRALQSV